MLSGLFGTQTELEKALFPKKESKPIREMMEEFAKDYGIPEPEKYGELAEDYLVNVLFPQIKKIADEPNPR